MTFDFYGNTSLLQNLSDNQNNYLARFKSIMQAIDQQARTTVSQWEGSGSAQYNKAAGDYQAHFDAVNGAFSRLVAATDTAGQNTARLCAQLDNLF